MYTYIIIDDERLIRLGLISKIEEISSEKFECIGEAENGKKGMELLEEITPDIIITDMKMAKMDGVEFLKNLHEIHPDIPVIVISGYKAFDYMSQAIEPVVVGYVLKPFSTEEIEKQLLKAVSRIEQNKNLTRMREKISDLEQSQEDMEFIKVITEPWNEEENDKQGFCMDNWHVLITIYTNVPDEMNILRECTKRLWENCAAIDNAPNVLNAVCHGYPAEYPTPIPPIIPMYGYMDLGSTRYSTINSRQPTTLNIPLLTDLGIQSSVKGRHTDIQAIPAHIALGSPRRFINSIALDTISVSFTYHLLLADLRSNSRNKSRKVLR